MPSIPCFVMFQVRSGARPEDPMLCYAMQMLNVNSFVPLVTLGESQKILHQSESCLSLVNPDFEPTRLEA